MEGYSNQQIVAALGIGLDTVKVHMQHLREKLGGVGAGERWWVKVGRAYERDRIKHGRGQS